MSAYVLLNSLNHARIQSGEGVWTPWKITKHRGFLSNTGPDPLKNHKATKPAFSVGPSMARQRIRWRADDDSLIVM